MLLIESMISKVRRPALLTESEVNCSIIEFAALPLDIETGNGRVYPTTVVRPAIEEANELVASNQKVLLCTADGHPPEENPEPINASHRILKSWIEDGYVWCQAEVLETSNGKDLQVLINLGIPLGVSVRGTGAVTGKRVSGYSFLGCDMVGTPSTGLMVKPIVMSDIGVSINECSEIKTSPNTFEYTKESENMDNKSSLSDIKMLFKESIQSIKETKSKIDRSTSFSLVETELAKVKIIECDTKFGARDLINVIKEWVELKEEIEEAQNPTDEGTNAEQDIAESKEDKEKSEKEMCEAKEKAEKEMCEAKEELEESKKELVNESKKAKLIADKLIESRTQLETIKTYYNDIKNTAQKTKKQLIDESLKTVGLRSLNDTRSRELRESAESSNKKIKTLINQNVSLMNESKQLIKIGAAYKLSAEQLAQKVIDLTENKS